ncbi:hypothetical protein SDC9_13777 [bioreactor metagenome]|uniref:Uncharacterized protein n=1 Tax=bioreactor metagenome TaxID=1076179 RepID=A0A644TMF7_9ZZZZ|nr:hypothetical protein [Negativicutes bacterium]
MLRTCVNFFKCMLYENELPSLTRFLSMVAFIAFLLCSAYLMFKEQNWQHYDTFAYITGGGGTTAQLFNKFVNSKYNSNQGDPAKTGEVRPANTKVASR